MDWRTAATGHWHVQWVGHIGDITQQQVSLLFSPVDRPGCGARAALSVRELANCVREQFQRLQVWGVKQASTTSWKLPRTEQPYQRGTSLQAKTRSTAFIVFPFCSRNQAQSAQPCSQANRNKPTFPGWVSHRLREVLGLISCDSNQLLIKKERKPRGVKKIGLCCFVLNSSLWRKRTYSDR